MSGRDRHRLHTDPSDISSPWMQAGDYILEEGVGGRQLTPFTGEPEQAILCMDGDKYVYNATCPNDQKTGFYRVITGK